MSKSEAILLFLVIALCVVPGFASSALLLRKARCAKVALVLIHALAVATPLAIAFVGESTMDGAIGATIVYGIPLAFLVGSGAIVFTIVWHEISTRRCCRSEK